ELEQWYRSYHERIEANKRSNRENQKAEAIAEASSVAKSSISDESNACVSNTPVWDKVCNMCNFQVSLSNLLVVWLR
ncbi:unnamed protein product, partial [Protopolystoma xenopodis]